MPVERRGRSRENSVIRIRCWLGEADQSVITRCDEACETSIVAIRNRSAIGPHAMRADSLPSDRVTVGRAADYFQPHDDSN